MRAALAAHDDVLRAAVEVHGGFLFKHTGDGVVAAFASPRSAVDAAVAAQRQLKLPVRMGIATGEAVLQEGDYFGAVLNRAARVMAAGHGGQILVADSTAGLLSGVDLVDLGSRRLRDVANPVTVFQLQAPGLRADFPPLRTVDANRGNLRPAATRLIGRDVEVAELAAAVRSRRLVTLTGVGGVGKTRLAFEVAAQLASEFSDGVWVFELAAATDPAAVPDEVAAVLGIAQQPGKTIAESVAAALEGRVRLLVFDNCEHVLDATADLVETILDHSTTVRIMATSREGLAIADEQVWPVRSLDVDAATSLFVERAHDVAPEFSVDEAGDVVEICRRLDGIPLAIELAASRISSMTASDIRDRLDHRFKLLVGTRRGVERHQTLRQAVQWSYDLLDDSEKALLARCSVFSGGFDVQSACAVAAFDEADDFAVLDLLDALVRKSLLVTDRSTGRARFSMLETIRQFAEEQLAARGEAADARNAHARHFAGREADILALWDGPRQREAYAWFTTELANLRSAFRWAADNNDVDTAATLATFVGLIAFLAENYEPTSWAEDMIEAARAVDHPRLVWLYQAASVCYLCGRGEQGVAYAEATRGIEPEGRVEMPFGFEGLAGGAYLMVGQPEKYVEWCRSYLERGRDTHGITRAALVNSLVFAGSGEEAMIAAEGLIEAAEATRNPWVISYALLSEGFAFGDADPVRAMEALRRGLVTTRESGNCFIESHMASALAGMEVKYGDPLAALDYITFAIRNYHDAGSVAFFHAPLANLAVILGRLGRYESAAVVIGYAGLSPLTGVANREMTTTMAHLQENLGAQPYESLAREGATTTPAAMVSYAYEQIDQARACLEQLP